MGHNDGTGDGCGDIDCFNTAEVEPAELGGAKRMVRNSFAAGLCHLSEQLSVSQSMVRNAWSNG